MKKKITKTTVDALVAGESISDTDLPGFHVRAGKHKVYCVKKRVGKKVLTRTIGRHGIYTADTARKRAQLILLQLSQGEDPLAARRLKTELDSLTFEALVDEYRASHSNAHTRRDITKMIRLLEDWLPKPANEISRQMVLSKFKEMTDRGATQAANVMRSARAVFNRGQANHRNEETGESLVRHNPINVLREQHKLRAAKRRSTFLRSYELPKWFEALVMAHGEHPVTCDYLLTTLLLGTRREEASGLRWQDVDLKDRTVVFRDTKNSTDHHLPIGSLLAAVLRNRQTRAEQGAVYVFPAPTRSGFVGDPRPAMRKIINLSGISFIVSDLRRTFATAADTLDISPYSIKRLMNHKTNANQDVTAGYIGINVEKQRERMQQIENYLMGLCQGQFGETGLTTTATVAVAV